MGRIIILESTLSFLGLGGQPPPDAELGFPDSGRPPCTSAGRGGPRPFPDSRSWIVVLGVNLLATRSATPFEPANRPVRAR